LKILVDENIPLMTVSELRLKGYEVTDIRGTDLEGSKDEKVWRIITKNEQLLITTDKGFIRYRFHDHHGILIIRLKKPNRHRIHARVMIAMNNIPESDWKNTLVVMKDEVESIWRK